MHTVLVRDSEHFVYSKMREDILHIVRWCGDLYMFYFNNFFILKMVMVAESPNIGEESEHIQEISYD